MNIVIFDTETTSLEKPFCYNIGYKIVDDHFNELLSREYVVEQVWHNKMCFASSYYAEKRPIYIERMRKHTIKMEKFGYICQQMIRDFTGFNVEMAFAYNSNFDEKVFNFNCDWFKCNNPFDNIPIKDIRAFAHKYIVDDEYKAFCDEHQLYTESGNYSTTAESVGKYIYRIDFEEEHTALADSDIECMILADCVYNGADLHEELVAKRSIEKLSEKTLTVKKNGETVFETPFTKITYRKSADTIILN